ncbi:hypothetical protein BD560DRAFT_442657 [Blakeslea trispora]|nr:hypothetical protein BD560DRAFT_442657 [Blakeslea trispora]
MNNNNNNNNNNNSNNTNGNNRVNGPTSALTSFLREHGIFVHNRNRRARRETRDNNDGQEVEATVTEASSSSTDTTTTAAATTTTTRTTRSSVLYRSSESKNKTKNKKRKRASDSDDSEDDEESDDNDPINDFLPSSSTRKPPSGRARIAFCDQCKGRFVRKTEEDQLATTCPKCLSGDNPKKAGVVSRKRKTIPAVKKKTVYSEKQVPSLQEICISVVVDYIEDIDTFGIMSDESFEKLSRIISRNRKLTDQVAKLFMEPDRRSLALGDCSKMTDNGLFMISQFCVQTQRLILHYCGQITDRTLNAYRDRLPQLKHLDLSGPFLVTKQAWIAFFEAIGKRLEVFAVSNTARFDQTCVDAMASHCPDLKELKLKNLSPMCSDWLSSIAKLNKLESLELAWPLTGQDFKTEDIVQLLSCVGSNLRELSIKGGHQLTDEILSNGILKHCPNLQKLCLEKCEQLTSSAMVAFLDNWNAQGLVELDISRCTAFDDDVLKAILRHSGQSIQQLNLHSLNLLTASALELLAGNGSDLSPCQSLTHLNCGFVHSMDDFVLQKLANHCESLKDVQVFGCTLLTDNVKTRDGLRIVGREI